MLMISVDLTRRIVATLGALAIVALAPAASVAQTEEGRGPAVPLVLPGTSMPCPQPISLKLTHGGVGVHAPAQPDPADFGSSPGGSFNQPSINQWFRDTFRFHTSNSKCCQFKDGKLTVTFKALQGGPANSSTSANDDAGVWYNNAPLPGSNGRINPGAVSTGATKTITYVVPAGIIASGKVSYFAEDDTAVVSATLEISGCCLEPTPIR